MLLFSLTCIVLGIIMIFLSRPLFSRKSFEWWGGRSVVKSTKKYSYLYKRYIMTTESLSLGILFVSVGVALYFNASELIISSILLLQGVMLVIFTTLLYFNNHLTQKLMTLSWFGDEPRNDMRYHIITLFTIGLGLIFFAYVFRPLDFYF